MFEPNSYHQLKGGGAKGLPYLESGAQNVSDRDFPIL